MPSPFFLRLALLLFIAVLVPAFRLPPAPAYPDFDRRPRPSTVPASKVAASARLQQLAPDAAVQFDPITRSAAQVKSRRGFLTGPEGRGRTVTEKALGAFPKHDPQRVTRAFLHEHRALFGHGPEALIAAGVKRDFVTAHNGLRTVVWEQRIQDIPVFEGLFTSHLTRRSELVSLSSHFVSDAAVAAQPAKANGARPQVSVVEALRAAGRSFDVILTPEEITVLEKSLGAPQPHRLKAARFTQEASAQLVWLPMGPDTLRLCWDVIVRLPVRGEFFRLLIDAETGEAILRRCLTDYLTNATYRVFTGDSPSPFSPGHATPLTNQPPVLARSLVTLSALNTNASPAGWMDAAVNETRGNNVDAHLDRDDNNVADLPRPQGSPFHVFDFPLDLDLDPALSGSAAVVNLFYWNNWMHDRLYELGFTEAAGNFQVNNFGRGGAGNDAVQADAQDGAGFNNANFYTPPDGISPRMQMFLFSGPAPDRDGDYDTEIVLHEYTHGLTGRRVGGGAGITALQSRGLGEGWSDFYALALLSEAPDNVDGNYAFGGYATRQFSGLTENYYYGVRRYPYSTDLAKNPLTFRDIDPTQADPHPSVPISPSLGNGLAEEVHNQGEVWGVALWEARANLIRKHGWTTGNQLILQLVTDALNLTPANPTFLEARDAIIQADLINTGGTSQRELWTAFAKRGMGASATGPASFTTTGVVEAFDLPDDLNVTPYSGFTTRGPVGGPFEPATATFTLSNAGSNTLTWTASKTAAWLDLAPTGGVLVPGTSVSVEATLNNAVEALPAGIYEGIISFTNVSSGVGQARTVSLRVGQPDYFAELFTGDLNVAHTTFTFTPDGSPGFYSVCREPATNFPTSPAGGAGVSLTDDSFQQITLTGSNRVALYTRSTNVVFLGSNGYLTFDAGDTQYAESFQSHFNRPRFSALFRDLNPTNSGTISWKQLSDRLAVTYQNVPEFIEPNRNSFQMEMFFDGRLRVTYLQIDAARGLVGLSAGPGVPAGFAASDFSSYGPCVAPLFIPVLAALTEGDGTVTNAGRVALPFPLATNLSITLTASDSSELLVPATVLVPAGSTNVFFDITVIDDTGLDGTQTAVLTADAPGFASSVRPVSVHDNEAATLGVIAPTSLAEGDGPALVIVTVSAPVATNVLVRLVSTGPDELQVPGWVTIPAGQTSAVFHLTVIDDTAIDGAQSVTLTATVTNWTAGQATVLLTDNETTSLSLYSLSPRYSEGAGLQPHFGAVSLSGVLPTNLLVALQSSDPASLLVPTSVILPAGQRSVYFDLTLPDNALVDGLRTVTLSAIAADFSAGETTVTVYDDESPPPPSSPIPPDLATNIIATTALNWLSGTNTSNEVYFGTRPQPGPMHYVGTTTGTQWNLPRLAPATTYYWQIVARDAGSTPGPVWSFTTRGVHHFALSSFAPIQFAGVPFPITITALDEFNATVSNFTATAQLAAQAGSGELFRADFEHGLDGFTLDNALGHGHGLWHLTTARGTQTGHSGSNSLYYGHQEGAEGHGNYDTGTVNEGAALSPPFDLASILPPVTLEFRHLIQTELGTNWDRASVEISTNDGATFTAVADRSPPIAFPHDSRGMWLTQSVDLTAFAIGPARLRFHFDTVDDGGNQFEGWFIDDVRVQGGAFLLPMSPPVTGLFIDGSWTGQVTILAPGTNVILTATVGGLPMNAPEPFVVLGGSSVSIFRSDATNVVVTWTAIPNRKYRVETKTNLEAIWESTGTDVTSTNTTGRLILPILPPQQFYRVRLLLELGK